MKLAKTSFSKLAEFTISMNSEALPDNVREHKIFIRRWIGNIPPDQLPAIAQALEELAQEFKRMGAAR